MTIIDTGDLKPFEKLPGWRGRMLHSDNMTFGYWDFDAGSSIHEHHHEQEEVWHLVEGEVEIVIGGTAHRVRAGMVAIVAPDTPHSVVALTDGRAIVCDHPLRKDFGP